MDLPGSQSPGSYGFPPESTHPMPCRQELPEARRLRENARQLLGFDPLEGPEVVGFYELLRGPEGHLELILVECDMMDMI